MKTLRIFALVVLVFTAVPVCLAPAARAIGSQQNPQSGSVGLEGTVPGAAPRRAATIAVPANGQVFTTTPITVSGLCETGLLVKVFSNNVFVGSAVCTNGSYSLKIDLFSGRNDLVARVYDALDQQGPDSNVVSVTFNDAQFIKFGTHVSLTSQYARRGANPGDTLGWPLILSGGTAPYALSVDWGDGNSAELKSVSFPGTINVSHVYTQAGVYAIIIKATDANGTAAYLQVVGVANGAIHGNVSTAASSGTTVRTVVIWQPMLLIIPLMLLSFWLGRRHELYALRRELENSRQ